MRALVTGATGFIGRHLVERLCADNFLVRALVHRGARPGNSSRNVKVVSGDVRDSQTMKAIASGCDIVFHLASVGHDHSIGRLANSVYWNVNIEGTRNLLNAAVDGGARLFVFFSSVKAMGEETAWPVDELLAATPVTEYGRSKLGAEQLVFDYGKRTGMHVICLRLPLVYGPGNRGNLYRMIKMIDRRAFPPLPDLGNSRSIVHVSNVVDAAILVATHSASNGQCYIVTDGRAYSTRELYELICRGLDRPIPRWSISLGALKLAARLGDTVGWVIGRPFFFDSHALHKLIASACYSSDKISRELGYRPSVTFEEALPDLIACYRKSQA